MSKSTIVITGNPVDGFNHYGPFPDIELTDDLEGVNDEYWVAHLQPPSELDSNLSQYDGPRAAAGVLPPPSAVNPGSSQPSVFRVLDLSTKHLPFEVCQDLNGFPGVIADERSEYGWFVWVPEDIDQHVAEVDAEDPTHPIPVEIVTIWRYAQRHDCQYVLFDRDAKVNPDLPTWEW